MKSTIIHDLPGWQVTSHGNGLAYTLLNKRTNEELFFQGDDAEQFRAELTAYTCSNAPVGPSGYRVVLDYSDALRVIWGEYAR